jgi:hypothetical protein
MLTSKNPSLVDAAKHATKHQLNHVLLEMDPTTTDALAVVHLMKLWIACALLPTKMMPFTSSGVLSA